MKHYTRTRPRGDNYSHSLAITRPETASEVTHWPGPAWPGPHWQSAATYTRAIYYNQHEGSTATNTGTAYSATPSLAAAQSGTEHLPNINPARLHCSSGGGRAQPATLTVRHSASTEHRHSAATEHQPGPTPLLLWRRQSAACYSHSPAQRVYRTPAQRGHRTSARPDSTASLAAETRPSRKRDHQFSSLAGALQTDRLHEDTYIHYTDTLTHLGRRFTRFRSQTNPANSSGDESTVTCVQELALEITRSLASEFIMLPNAN